MSSWIADIGRLDVHGDLAAQVAEVGAERHPGLVANDLQDDAFAVRQLDESTRPDARLVDDRRGRALDLLSWHADRLFPALVALGQRSLAGEQLLEPLVRRGEGGFVGMRRPHAVAALHLVGVRAGLPCQHAGVGSQADDLVVQPAVLDLAEQRLCVGDECPRLDRRLRVDGGGELRRPEVGVDDAVDVPADLQPESEVALRGGLAPVGRRSRHRRRRTV